MNALQAELSELKARRQQQEIELANIENIALRQRFQDILDNLLSEQLEKEQQVRFLFGMNDSLLLKYIINFCFAVSRTRLPVGLKSIKRNI